MKKKLSHIFFLFTGFASLIWFFVRVIPKPSRAAYPCQRAAFPLASTFVLWLTGTLGIGAVLSALRRFSWKNRFKLLSVALAGVAVFGCVSVADQVVSEQAFTSEPALGTPRGANPGRVVWVHDSDMVDWDETDGSQYWSPESVNQEFLDRRFSESLCALAGEENDDAAWDTLFQYTNRMRGRPGEGYVAGEQIAIKINENNQDNPYAIENEAIDASPHVVLALLHQLVQTVGVAEEDLIVYDALRPISDPLLAYCRAVYPEVHYYGGNGYPNNTQTEFPWAAEVIHYSNGRIPMVQACNIPQFVVDADYLINMALLKSHGSVTGVTLCGKNHYGTIGDPSQIHSFTHSYQYGSYSPQVDIIGHDLIWKKTVLYMIDGLFGSSGCVSVPSRWDSAPFDGNWPSSLLLSQDIVAIDSVGLDFLAAETTLWDFSDGYLHEAALADDPLSGIFYDPEGDGVPMQSLGVHEHWDHPESKNYRVIDFIKLLN